MNCPNCDNDLSEYTNFDYLCEDPIVCFNCSQKLELNYDESYDYESGEECGWFWFERID